MKLIMENWRKFLIEQQGSNQLENLYNKNVYTDPKSLRKYIILLARYSPNEAIRTAAKEINKDKSALKMSAKEKCFIQAGEEYCEAGAVKYYYDHEKNRRNVTSFEMNKNEKVERVKNEIKSFLYLVKGYDQNKIDTSALNNFFKFCNVLAAVIYSSTYVHELYHYWESENDKFKSGTEEWQMMANMGYQSKLRPDAGPEEAKTEVYNKEIRAIRVEEQYVKHLKSSLPIHLVKTEKFPGNLSTWVEPKKIKNAEVEIVEYLDKLLIPRLFDQVKRYKASKMKNLQTLLQNKGIWKKLHPEIQPDTDGPFGTKWDTKTNNAGELTTKSWQGSKKLTGKSKPLPSK